MALGKVEITSQAITDVATDTVEGKVLFIGLPGSGATATAGNVETLSATFDQDDKFGKTSNLAKQIKVAKSNNPKLQGWAISYASGKKWSDVIDAALLTAKPEIVALTDEMANKTEIQAVQTKASALEGTNKRVIFLVSIKGTDTTKTIAQSITDAKVKVANLSAPRVAVLPINFENEIGAIAGRISKLKVHQTPMITGIGALASVGEKIKDKNGDVPVESDLISLDAAGFSVVQWYENLSGYYPADVNLFDPNISKLEYRRTLDKATRGLEKVALLQIGQSVQNTPAGNAGFLQKLAKPLRTMALAGEIEPVLDSDIALKWVTSNKVQVSFKIRPFKTPKEISMTLTLDTTTSTATPSSS